MEVRPTRELGSAEFRALQAFREAYDRRGNVPAGVVWESVNGVGRWSDAWTPASAGAHLLRRHMRNMALMSGAHEQPAMRHTPEVVESEIAEYLRRKQQADKRQRDKIRSCLR